MLERGCIVVLAVLLTGLTLVSVAGHGPFAGSVLVTLTYNHGIDEGDVPIAFGWVVGMGCLAVLWRRTNVRP